jgi:hypothetical protein
MGILDRIGRVIFKNPPKSAIDLPRNAPCWCGSGKKYKKCHYESDRRYFASRASACKTYT